MPLAALLLGLCLAAADAAPAPAASGHPDLPDALKGVSHTRKARLTSAWGGYQLRLGGPVLALSADGRRAASAGLDAPLRLFDLDTGRQLRVLAAAHEGTTSAAFSADGKHLAVGGHDGVLSVFDLETGKLARTFKRHQGEVGALAFSPDGKRLASGGEDGTVRVWPMGQGRSLVLPGHSDAVGALVFFPDGTRLASASADGTVRVWDLAKGRALQTIGLKDGPEALAVAVSPDGARLLIGREGAGVSVLELAGGVERVLGPAPRVLALAFAPEGDKALAICTNAREVRLAASRDPSPARLELRRWDLESGEALPPLGSPGEGFVAAALSGDGRRALTSGDGLTLWDLETGGRLYATGGHTARVEAVAMSPDGRLALSAADDGTARLWEAFSGKELFTFGGYARNVRVAAYSADGARALIGDANGLIRIWDVAALSPLGFIGPHRGVLALAWADEGKSVVSASVERTAVWDVATGKEVLSNWFPRIAVAVALSADGKLVMMADIVDGPQMREAMTGKILKPLRRADRLTRAGALTRDGDLAALVTAPADNSGPEALELWDTASGKLLRLTRAAAGTRSLAFSADGRLLLAGAEDGTARLYVVKTLREADRVELQPNVEQPSALTFAPDGLSFLIGTSVGALQHYLIVGDPSR